MPSKLDPHVTLIEGWLAAEPQLTAIAIVGRLADLHPDQFGKKQHSTVQRLLRALRRSAAQRLVAETAGDEYETVAQPLSPFQPSTLIHPPTSYIGPPGKHSQMRQYEGSHSNAD
jgi:hypothetical protein